jgi:hypothetical protein
MARSRSRYLAARRNGPHRELIEEATRDEFKQYRPFVGADANGEPNGALNEDARYLVNPNSMLDVDLDLVAQAPERVTQKLNGAGITAFLDAMTVPGFGEEAPGWY